MTTNAAAAEHVRDLAQEGVGTVAGLPLGLRLEIPGFVSGLQAAQDLGWVKVEDGRLTATPPGLPLMH